MKPRLLSLTFLFAGLILSSRTVYAVDFCITPDFAQAVDRAEVVFSGKITNIEPAQSRTAVAGEYVVTLKAETWWKGKPVHETRVLWRSSLLNCPFLPVGEVGEDYLVYADPSKNEPPGNQFPEVTIFNRTSRLPSNPESVLIDDWSRQTRLSPNPTLNRADASNDIKLLRTVRECDCLTISHLPPPLASLSLTSQPDSREGEGVSTCQTCLRRRLKPF